MKILTSSFFNQYAQYAYQMKAENILNLNLTSEHMICYKKLCIWSTFIFFVYEKILTGQLRWAPAARLCNFSTKKFHQKVPLDAKRKVKRCQVSTTTHTAAGRDQRRSGLIRPPPTLHQIEICGVISAYLGLCSSLCSKKRHTPARSETQKFEKFRKFWVKWCPF